MKKISKVIYCLFLPAFITSCSNNVTFDKKNVRNIRNLGYVTGPFGFCNTMVEYGLGSCDLGYPVYIEDANEMYYLFGDSFSQNHQSGAWKSNVAAISTDFDLSDGLILDDALKTPSGYLKAIYNGHHTGDKELEVTKIPTGLCYINKTIYMFYFSMYDWSGNLDNRMNNGGLIKSSDKGETWERVYDCTWCNFSPDMTYGSTNTKERIESLINEDIDNMPREGDQIKVEDHCGFDATQIFPLDGKDGYVYLFLEGGYRNRHLKIGRVTYENIEKFNEYEYMQRYDSDGKPVWMKGYDGLKALYNNTASEITTYNFGEMSALYNPYLKKYCLLTSTTGGVNMFTSKTVYGPYTDIIHLYTQGDPVSPINETTGERMWSAYAPLTHEKMLARNGKIMYFLCSSWIPCYNPCLYEVTFK